MYKKSPCLQGLKLEFYQYLTSKKVLRRGLLKLQCKYPTLGLGLSNSYYYSFSER